MWPTLLEQFLAEECTEHIRALLLDALDGRPSTTVGRAFEFNRFAVAIDGSNGAVTIEDLLDVSDAGVARLTSSEFRAALLRST